MSSSMVPAESVRAEVLGRPDEGPVPPTVEEQSRAAGEEARKKLTEAAEIAEGSILRGEASTTEAVALLMAKAQEIDARHERALDAIAERAANAQPALPPGAGLRIVLEEMDRAAASHSRVQWRPFVALSRPTRTARRTTARRGASFGAATCAASSDDEGGGEPDPPSARPVAGEAMA